MTPSFIYTPVLKREYLLKHRRIEGECWIYTGKLNVGHGLYGQVPWRQSAHRAAYEVFIGSIPTDREVAHICHTPQCINPEHLIALTHQDHVAFDTADRQACSKGHPYTPENLYHSMGKRKYRACKICMRENARRNYMKRKYGTWLSSRT